MRRHLSLTVLLIAAPLALLAPTASADAWCRGGEPDCPYGQLFCTYRPQVCVPDPCDDTACWYPSAENHNVCNALPQCPVESWVCGVRPHTCVPDLDSPLCVTVYDFPDLGYRICVTATDPECRVYEERITIAGTQRRCLYPGDGASA